VGTYVSGGRSRTCVVGTYVTGGRSRTCVVGAYKTHTVSAILCLLRCSITNSVSITCVC